MKADYFDCYPVELMRGFSYEHQGQLMFLRWCQWRKGFIPGDRDALDRLLNVPTDGSLMAAIGAHFPRTEGNAFHRANPELAKLRERHLARRDRVATRQVNSKPNAELLFESLPAELQTEGVRTAVNAYYSARKHGRLTDAAIIQRARQLSAYTESEVIEAYNDATMGGTMGIFPKHTKAPITPAPKAGRRLTQEEKDQIRG